MLETGADQSVVVMKAGNAAGAKGLSLSKRIKAQLEIGGKL